MTFCAIAGKYRIMAVKIRHFTQIILLDVVDIVNCAIAPDNTGTSDCIVDAQGFHPRRALACPQRSGASAASRSKLLDIALSRYPAIRIFQLMHAFGVHRCKFVRLAALVETRKHRRLRMSRLKAAAHCLKHMRAGSTCTLGRSPKALLLQCLNG